jgi:hypothetical protein
MHLRGTRKKPSVAQWRYGPASAQVLQGFKMQGAGRKGKVTRAPDLQSARGRISSANRKITVLF